MIRFGLYPDTHHTIMGRDAGLAALDDAGVSMKDIDAVYVGHLFMPAMAGVRAVKEIGMKGVPVQRVENASATGTAAMREAYLAIAGMKRCPTYTASMSFILTPASSSAARPASRPMMV